MTIHSDNWDTPAPLPDMEAELKKIRRDIRRRNWKIILTSLILVAAIFLGTIKFAIPALESQYWNPETSTYEEGIPDLQITLEAYTELFHPGFGIASFESNKTGFASYSLNVQFFKWTDSSSIDVSSTQQATLTKGELKFSPNFWKEDSINVYSFSDTTKKRLEEDITFVTKTLNKYPEYIQLLAIITFPEDLSMEELHTFNSELSNYQERVGTDNNYPVYKTKAKMIWAAISNGANRTCGFSPQFRYTNYYSNYTRFLTDSKYPYLFGIPSNYSGDIFETHFKSLLRFSQDQVDIGTGILPESETNSNYYDDTLAYVEENGVKSPGAYILTSPSVLRTLIQDGSVSGARILDAWVGGY